MTSQNTPNKFNIAEEQNKIHNLERLSAQNYLYSCAKKYKVIQFILSVVILILIAFLRIAYQDASEKIIYDITWGKISPFLSLISILITFVNIYWLKSILSNKIQSAAYVQYDFDCNVLDIKKNELITSDNISLEDIRSYCKKNQKKGNEPENFKDWYSNKVKSVDVTPGGLICLRSNYRWDIRLRIFYRNIIAAFIVVYSLAFFIPPFVNGTTLKEFILEIIVPLLPLITFTLSELFENNKSLSKKNSAVGKIESHWNKMLKENIEEDITKNFIKESLEHLYYLRKENPLIFNWVYKVTKLSNADQMEYSTERLVEQYMRKK